MLVSKTGDVAVVLPHGIPNRLGRHAELVVGRVRHLNHVSRLPLGSHRKQQRQLIGTLVWLNLEEPALALVNIMTRGLIHRILPTAVNALSESPRAVHDWWEDLKKAPAAVSIFRGGSLTRLHSEQYKDIPRANSPYISRYTDE